MAYTKTTWVNDAPPDIDADNLNKMEQGIYDAQFPDGGTPGQVLTKTADGETWADVDGLPSGGTAGQVLTKNSSTDGDASWATMDLSAKANTSTLATVETGATASKAYAVGDYLVYNGILYRVTATISAGQTLTPGTNISATNAGAELTSLNNGLTQVGNHFISEQFNWRAYNDIQSALTANAQTVFQSDGTYVFSAVIYGGGPHFLAGLRQGSFISFVHQSYTYMPETIYSLDGGSSWNIVT